MFQQTIPFILILLIILSLCVTQRTKSRIRSRRRKTRRTTPKPTTVSTSVFPATTTRFLILSTKKPFLTKSNLDFWSLWRAFFCEKLYRCNIIPEGKVCGRDWATREIFWFENICVMWTSNCKGNGLFYHKADLLCLGQPVEPALKVMEDYVPTKVMYFDTTKF